MTELDRKKPRRRRRGEAAPATVREVSYHPIRNRLPHAEVFSADQVAAIHDTALRVLEELGLKVLLDDARARYRAAGALVDDESQMVRIGRDIVAEALSTAPGRYVMFGRRPERDTPIGGDAMFFTAGGGCPNVTDIGRGRRGGSFADFLDFLKLNQGFDVLPKLTAWIEPQDVPIHLRHLETTRAQLVLSDKVPFIYSRGHGQIEDSFAMMRIAHGLSEEEFRARPSAMTIINTNSPRQIDKPMAQGIIDFARHGQICVVSPFCLSGAMAPITIAGALTLSHAECLAGLALNQITRPGAPFMYGAFSSNVHMKSGAPVFGTPEHVKTNIAAGQLARHVGLPWRVSTGSASNTPDAQAAQETLMGIWGAVLAGGNMITHAAGWLEGGLTISYEKFITDIEALQIMAEVMQPVHCGPDELGFEAIAEVAPGGHFFAARQTMERYATAFYEPFVWDWSNFGQWTEAGGKTATERAHDIWQRRLAAFEPPPIDPGVVEALDAFVARRAEQGGAPPLD
jgi:trimethylamine--corrinoid protein Co-methyltransferase